MRKYTQHKHFIGISIKSRLINFNHVKKKKTKKQSDWLKEKKKTENANRTAIKNKLITVFYSNLDALKAINKSIAFELLNFSLFFFFFSFILFNYWARVSLPYISITSPITTKLTKVLNVFVIIDSKIIGFLILRSNNRKPFMMSAAWKRKKKIYKVWNERN